MKLEITIDNNTVVDAMDAVFVAMLKHQREESIKSQEVSDHPDDIKANKQYIKACGVILKHYGVYYPKKHWEDL